MYVRNYVYHIYYIDIHIQWYGRHKCVIVRVCVYKCIMYACVLIYTQLNLYSRALNAIARVGWSP